MGAKVASQEVEVVDVSRGGVLFDTGQLLQPGGERQLEFVLTDESRRLRGRVVRSHVAALLPSGPRYRVAIKFHQPLELQDLSEQPAPVEAAAQAGHPEGESQQTDQTRHPTRSRGCWTCARGICRWMRRST